MSQKFSLVIHDEFLHSLGMTKRRGEIIRLVCTGHGNHAIGQKLGIKTATVKSHLSKIFIKLRIGSRLELATFVFNELTKGDMYGQESCEKESFQETRC